MTAGQHSQPGKLIFKYEDNGDILNFPPMFKGKKKGIERSVLLNWQADIFVHLKSETIFQPFLFVTEEIPIKISQRAPDKEIRASPTVVPNTQVGIIISPA